MHGEDERLEWEERAAIMEFDGMLSRLEAERRATEILAKLHSVQRGLFDD